MASVGSFPARTRSPTYYREAETGTQTPHPTRSGGFELSISPPPSHAFSPGPGGALCASARPVHPFPAPRVSADPILTVPSGASPARWVAGRHCTAPRMWPPFKQQSRAVKSHPPTQHSSPSCRPAGRAQEPRTTSPGMPSIQSEAREEPLDLGYTLVSPQLLPENVPRSKSLWIL